MGRILAALLFVMLLAPDASAQVSSGGQTATPLEVAAQASYDTGYLLALYMESLASAGTPPTAADIDEAARLYLTNGAAVTGVPSSGPGAAYFQNGAEVTGVPTTGPGAEYFQNGAEVLAYRTPVVAPGQEPAQEATVGAEARPSSPSSPESAGEDAVRSDEGAAKGASASPPPQSQSGGGPSTDLTCSPREIEAAMAFASQFAMGAASAPPPEPAYAPATTPISATPISATPAAEPTPALVRAPAAVTCPSEPSAWSRYLAVAIGAILGGLAVALWSRPRALRVAHRH
jgi:hypothetical protein